MSMADLAAPCGRLSTRASGLAHSLLMNGSTMQQLGWQPPTEAWDGHGPVICEDVPIVCETSGLPSILKGVSHVS